MQSSDVAAAVKRGKREILDDVRSGRVPFSVKNFSELHDYVDANEYGGLCDEDQPYPFSTDEWLTFGNAVQDALNAWIVGGGIPRPLGFEVREMRKEFGWKP
jgi:hypothetical protein